MNLPGLSDSIASVIADPRPCPHCDSSSHIAGGLCVGCLLEAGLARADEDESETLTDLLADLHLPDQNWRLGNYEILEEIGRGGMGVIYRARQRHSRRIVAVKRVLSYHSDSRETLARFRREAQAAASLDHPNILPIYEVSESEEGLPFFSMKFAPGGTLQQVAPALRNEPRQCVALVAKIARAVQYAHSKGILHRDLKPGNILLDGRGEPLVSDFGLAKWLDATSDLTRTLTIFGTPGYIAPEQASASAAELKPAADVYSLGAILFDLLAGRPPFLGAHALSVIRQAAESPAPKLRTLSKVADRDLETICSRCLEREPSTRYRSAHDLAQDLERWLEGRPIIARPVLPHMQVWRWSRRNPVLAASFFVSLLLGLATVGWLIHSQHLAGTLRQQALATNSVVVLPFLDLDTGQHDSSLSTAFADVLRDGLAPLATSKVTLSANDESWVAGTGNPTDFREAYQRSQCRRFVTGTTRNSHGNRSVSLRLINAANGEILWRGHREGTDIKSVITASAGELISHTYRSFSSDTDSSRAVSENDPAIQNPTANDFIVSARQLMLRMTVGDFDRSIQCLQRAIILAPGSATAHAYLAIAAAGRTHFQPDEGLLREAEDEARKAVELNPDSALSHRALAGVIYQQRQFPAALEEHLRAIEAGGAEERSVLAIGIILLKLGLPARALVWFHMAQHWATLPGDHDAWIGDCWSALRDDERAEAAYRRCMDLRPELADGWVGLCHLRLLQRNPEAARLLLAENSQRFKSYNDSNHDPELLRAAIEFYDRKYVEAERLYREITTKDYNSQEGFYGAISPNSALGRLKQLLGDEKEGRAILEKQLDQQVSLTSRSQDPALLYEISAIEACLNHSDQALNYLQTAMDKGWIDVRTMQIDPRFDSLVGDARYQSCISILLQKIEQMRRKPDQSIRIVSNSGKTPAPPRNKHE
jgi:serine/threonine protein kinase/tetratricopeptide (TPR) repeat protein